MAQEELDCKPELDWKNSQIKEEHDFFDVYETIEIDELQLTELKAEFPQIFEIEQPDKVINSQPNHDNGLIRDCFVSLHRSVNVKVLSSCHWCEKIRNYRKKSAKEAQVSGEHNYNSHFDEDATSVASRNSNKENEEQPQVPLPEIKGFDSPPPSPLPVTPSLAESSPRKILSPKSSEKNVPSTDTKVEKHNREKKPKMKFLKRQFKCKECDRTFPWKYLLNTHSRVHSKEKPYKCDICERAFSQKETFNTHKKIHAGERPFECNECKRTFPVKRYLRIHLRLHFRDRPFECEKCGKTYPFKRNLKIHLLTHEEVKRYKCNECEKTFAQKTNLAVHIRIHSGVKPYKCLACQRSFTQHVNLKRHLQIHSGEKPYACDQCQKKFRSKFHLTRHLPVHSGEKPFKCEECGHAFNVKESLTRHKKRKHVIDTYESLFGKDDNDDDDPFYW